MGEQGSSAGNRPWFPMEQLPPCCEPHPFMQAENLSLSYNGKRAFQGITISINKGCITALVGPSGCGKTSFLMSLNRLSDLLFVMARQLARSENGEEVLWDRSRT